MSKLSLPVNKNQKYDLLWVASIIFLIYERCRLRAARRKSDEDRVASAVCAVDKAGTDINVLIKPWQQLGRGEGSRNKESGEYNLFILPQ